MSESSVDQDRIEGELKSTRARLDGHLTELQQRLTPGRVLDDLMSSVRGSEGGDFARSLMDSVRGNPLPAALTGIGLAWLMVSDMRPQRGEAEPRAELDRRLRAAEQEVVRRNDEGEAAYRIRLDDARAKALGIARQPNDTADSFGKRIKDAMAAARQGVADGAHGLQERASDATRTLGSAAHSAGQQLVQGGQAAQQMGGNLVATITDNPVLLGAVGLAVGALLGALVPQSDQEEAALGGMASQARTAARDLAQGVVDRGGEVAQQALNAGRDSAHAQGLTSDMTVGDLVGEARSGELSGNVKQVALDVLKAGDATLRKDGPGQPHDGAAGTAPGTPAAT